MLKDDLSCIYPSKWGRSLSSIVATMDQHAYGDNGLGALGH